MAEIILMCGMICSGKSHHAKRLAKEKNAVILSTDEATKILINNEQGDFYLEFVDKVNLYLRKKAVDIVKTGTNVILDWGFWTKEDRRNIKSFLSENGVSYSMYFISISDSDWERNIKERNERIEKGEGGSDFYVDEGLKNKVLSVFEAPDKSEIDYVILNERNI